MIRLLVDENIPYATEVLSAFGEVRLAPGRRISRVDLKDIDALIVRSVTAVNRELLQGSAVRFVGSTTIGDDHLDKTWLCEAGIRFTTAPGCNAEAVADYVLASLLAVDGLAEALLAGEPAGIVGFGNVGRALSLRFDTLGIAWRAYDPFLSQPAKHLAPLDQVLQSRLLCLHMPLTRDGPHPTWHCLNASQLNQLPAGATLLNAGRGAVVATDALLSLADQRPDIDLVLDVWEKEPQVDRHLVMQSRIATPHIAGYSLEGKWRGLIQVAHALAEHMDKPDWSPSGLLPQPGRSDLEGAEGLDGLRRAVNGVWSVEKDSAALKHLATEETLTEAAFDQLRRNYPVRRELASTRLLNADGLPDAWKALFAPY